MADEAGEVNTAVEDGEAEQQQEEPEVSEAATDGEPDDSDAPEQTEKSAPAAAENSWSAPLLSLARKATETISCILKSICLVNKVEILLICH